MEAATEVPEYDLGPALRLEERIDAAEHEAIRDRWEFGRWMLTYVPEGGKKLPDGFLDSLCEATGKSRSELQFRRRFAERCESEEALCNALHNHRSWGAVIDSLGTAHVSNNSGDNEWYTPPELIEAARDVMGGIDLDPASSADANSIVKAKRFYTALEDGLAQEWSGRVWMNPPYASKLILPFCVKLAEGVAEGRVTQAIALVNNGTETAWFQRMGEIATALCLPTKRVKFWHPEKESAPLQGQALVYFGEGVNDFCRRFTQFGLVAVFR